jgi:hypothetical protein
MALSVRTRFEVFKRDEFTCGYCGRKSPEVVLEIDHIVPRAGSGSDDPINLLTSCWECNRGKSDIPLARIVTGEDPHDKAIEILEKRRQLEEYNRVLAEEDYRLESDTWVLIYWWNKERGYGYDGDPKAAHRSDYRWLKSALRWCPREKLREFMNLALDRRADKNFRYVAACARNWRYENMAEKDMKGDDYQ